MQIMDWYLEIKVKMKWTLVGLEFTCPGGSGITTTIYPENGARNYQLVGVSSEQTFQVNVGTSTITHGLCQVEL